VNVERPDIAVVVPSHNRPIRLRWLLNALEEQTLDRSRFEVVVAHDSTGDATADLLNTHPLAADGTLRHVRFEPRKGAASKLRNAGWRAATAPVVVFTDDDCCPPPTWLERALGAAHEHPDAIIQGMTLRDPLEDANAHSPWPHSQRIIPPQPWAQTCNIIYPRTVLERHDGWLEEPPLLAGEDTELAIRARQAGTEYLGREDVLTYHAVDEAFLPQRVRSVWRWGDLAMLVKRHPEFRDEFPLWIFWKRSHVWLPFAIYGIIKERKNPLYGVLALPWLLHTQPRRGLDVRSRLRDFLELPGRFVLDVTEFLALVWGSIKHRTLFL
jgi:GT2 family glycosyltransferase